LWHVITPGKALSRKFCLTQVPDNKKSFLVDYYKQPWPRRQFLARNPWNYYKKSRQQGFFNCF
ncbi:MAG: hypothetical protein ACPLRR_05080, partial [Candidatus Saccharicenans sp.]